MGLFDVQGKERKKERRRVQSSDLSLSKSLLKKVLLIGFGRDLL